MSGKQVFLFSSFSTVMYRSIFFTNFGCKILTNAFIMFVTSTTDERSAMNDVL